MFGPLSMDMYLPGLPSMARDLSAPAWAAQATISACMLGLGVGQLFVGGLSDAIGRRRPLLVGLGLYALASVLCAIAPNIGVLVAMRLIQGLAGAAGLAIARAVVRDLHEGAAAVRAYGLILIVSSVAPIVAPVLGGQLLHVTNWRGIFLVLAAIGLAIAVWTGCELAETLPAAARHRGGVGGATRVFGRLLRDRRYMGYTLPAALCFGALVAYIAGSPFVLENLHGLSPAAFSVVFAINGLGLAGSRQLSRVFAAKAPPGRLMVVGLLVQLAGGFGVLATSLLGGGVVAVLVSLFLVVGAVGIVMPNAIALAMDGQGGVAGSAAGLLGLLQFATGAVIAPLVGLAGARSAVPMALAVAILPASGIAVQSFLRPGRA